LASLDFQLAQKSTSQLRQQYLKLAQQHKALQKQLDNQTLNYEKRQKLEIQSNQIKTELESVNLFYKKSIPTTVNATRVYYTEKLPLLLNSLEGFELERVKLIKTTYHKYAAIAHTAIPITRQICDQLIFSTDHSEENDQKIFVSSIASAISPPLKPPRVPRYKVFGDPNDSDEEDRVIIDGFERYTHGNSSKAALPVDANSSAASNDNPLSVSDADIPVQESAEKLFSNQPVSENQAETTVEITQSPEPKDSSGSHQHESQVNVPTSVKVAESTPAPLVSSGNWVDDILGFSGPSKQPPVSSLRTSAQKKPSLPSEATPVSAPVAGSTPTPNPNSASTPASIPIAHTSTHQGELTPKLSPPELSPDYQLLSDPETVKEVESLESQLARLQDLVGENDYYVLFDIHHAEDLPSILNKKNALLEKFAGQSQRITLIHEVYSSIFRNDKTKNLYDRLCAYRREYNNLLVTDTDRLQRAVTNLDLLGKTVHKAGFPSGLHTEVTCILTIVAKHRNISP
jgi:hypothetical protein